MYTMSPDVEAKKMSFGLFRTALRAVVMAVLFTILACAFMPGVSNSAVNKRAVLLSVIMGDELMGGFNEPAALFFDENKKRIYIADTGNDRLVSIGDGFIFLSELTDPGFTMPLSVVKNDAGVFFVLDGNRGKIVVIDAANKIVKDLEVKGVPDAGNKFVPGRMAIGPADGRLYVADRLNKRLLIINADDGTVTGQLAVKKTDFNGVSDLRVDRRGYVYVLDSVAAMVHVFDDKGKLISSFGGRKGVAALTFPVSLAVDNNSGEIYVLDRHSGKIFVFDLKGRLHNVFLNRGFNNSELYTPDYLFIDASSVLYVIDGRRIQIFRIEEVR